MRDGIDVIKWIIPTLFLLALIFAWLGRREMNSNASPDQKLGAVIPYGIAILLFAADVLLIIGWAIYKLVTG